MSAPTDPWDEYAPFYDWENARTLGRRDLTFWAAWLSRQRGRALEFGCGTGRLLIPLARRGARLTGLDRSATMIARARQRARRLPISTRPRLIRGDMRALPFRDGAFRSAFAPYGMLQSLASDEDLEAAIAETARILQPGGRFGIDLVPDLPVWPTYKKAVTLRGRLGRSAVTLTESVRQDRARGLTIFDEVFTTRAGGASRDHRFQLTFRTIPMDTMLARLSANGLDVEDMYGDYAKGRWTPDADAWIMVGKKRR